MVVGLLLVFVIREEHGDAVVAVLLSFCLEHQPFGRILEQMPIENGSVKSCLSQRLLISHLFVESLTFLFLFLVDFSSRSRRSM